MGASGLINGKQQDSEQTLQGKAAGLRKPTASSAKQAARGQAAAMPTGAKAAIQLSAMVKP
jgi:hypothetical protein